MNIRKIHIKNIILDLIVTSIIVLVENHQKIQSYQWFQVALNKSLNIQNKENPYFKGFRISVKFNRDRNTNIGTEVLSLFIEPNIIQITFSNILIHEGMHITFSGLNRLGYFYIYC